MKIVEAAPTDCEAMSAVLQELIVAGVRRGRGDRAHVLSHYVEHPHRLHCFLALDDQHRILGFQSLKRADDRNPYRTPVGWGIIGTHVRPSAARRGVGSRLFAATLEGARAAELPVIEAYIGEENCAALAYYAALGFKTHDHSGGIIRKRFEVAERL